MFTLDSLFEQFLRERRYLKNVSPKTEDWYRSAWKAFISTRSGDGESITRAQLTAFVIALRDRGLRTVTINTWLRALNAFSRWLYEERHLTEQIELRPLKVEKRLVKTLDETALRSLLAFRPKLYPQWRVLATASVIERVRGQSD